MKGETTTLPDETKRCLRTILLEDKGIVHHPISGQTYHSKN